VNSSRIRCCAEFKQKKKQKTKKSEPARKEICSGGGFSSSYMEIRGMGGKVIFSGTREGLK
jgi:hypothetical protein